jgi:hypothetical protein
MRKKLDPLSVPPVMLCWNKTLVPKGRSVSLALFEQIKIRNLSNGRNGGGEKMEVGR